MIKEVIHIGITVRDIEESILFYRDILGLDLVGRMSMKGDATDILFQRKDCEVKLAYLNGSEQLTAPPIELLEFVGENGAEEGKKEVSLTNISISEICFRVEDIEALYLELKEKGVKFLSAPQYFDFTEQGFGRSKAVYFEDCNGIILELMEYIE